jgi:hypothetical protein
MLDIEELGADKSCSFFGVSEIVTSLERTNERIVDFIGRHLSQMQ